MKQLAQRLRDGRVEVLDVPRPAVRAEGVLVDVRASVVSAGTERKKVERGRQTLVGKARARPDQVRNVIEKARRDGVTETVRAVSLRLDAPEPLGYACAGIVVAAGERVTDLAPGDRVACGGAGYAVHAELDFVPANLSVPVPADVDFDAAAFATVGAIALHGVRQADVRIGERVAVVGLGLVGQLAGQILRAAGCRVVGIDLANELVRRALEHGAADDGYDRGALAGPELPAAATACDAVLVTAATASSDPVRFAARLARDRARVVVLGDVGIEIPRDAYYEKELELRLSRSYGPGRYDPSYEERGLDYPIGYVRWTERRNMAAFLDLVASGRVVVDPLVTERVSLDDAPAAYDRMLEASHSPLAIVIGYEPGPRLAQAGPPRTTAAPTGDPLAVGLIGAGSFASRVLIPGLRDAGFALASVASGSGLSARAAADRFGFGAARTTDEVIEDRGVGLVAVATRHGSHASLTARALRAGKAVFVEKPPCLTWDELADLRAARSESGRLLAVGFNRRHAPLMERLRAFVRRGDEPWELVIRVNAGSLPRDHWLNDPDEGGGRLLGEGCHFVDLACWFAGTPPERVTASVSSRAGRPLSAAETFTIALGFAGGSAATIAYGSSGSARLPKEYVEGHAGGRSAVLDDFRSLTLLAGGRRRSAASRGRDKGHTAQFVALRRALQRGRPLAGPDPLDSMATTLAALDAAKAGRSLPVGRSPATP